MFNRNATVVVVAFGMNDIGGTNNGNANNMNQQHHDAYVNGINQIVTACKNHNPPVRVILNSYPFTYGTPGQTTMSRRDVFLHDMGLDAFNSAVGIAPACNSTAATRKATSAPIRASARWIRNSPTSIRG